jgi:uncharacterized protein with LGFP repeats
MESSKEFNDEFPRRQAAVASIVWHRRSDSPSAHSVTGPGIGIIGKAGGGADEENWSIK